MHQKMQLILDSIPDSPTRSKLEPYRDFIQALRQKRKTYRQIAELIATNFDLPVDHTTIVRFVKVRAKQRRLQVELPVQPLDIAGTASTPSCTSPSATRPATPNVSRKPFHFDPAKGLTLSDDALNLKPRKD